MVNTKVAYNMTMMETTLTGSLLWFITLKRVINFSIFVKGQLNLFLVSLILSTICFS